MKHKLLMRSHVWKLPLFLTIIAVFLYLQSPAYAHQANGGVRSAAGITAITTPQATNDATNVYYQFTYTTSYTYYRVYIDTDQTAGTGFQTNSIGANYLLENSLLWRYTGTGTNWSWSQVKTVNYSNTNFLAKWAVARSDIGEGATPNQADLIFQVESPLTSTAKYTHVYSGASTPTPTPTVIPPVNTKTVVYSATTSLFANPERGLYHYVETRASAQQPYDLATLRGYRTNENITLIYCLNYLDSFVNQPITQTFLDHLQANLNTVRAAGLKCVLRFAYTDKDPTQNGEQPPFGDASKAQVLAHLQQLETTLRTNSDVIALVQAGFIGTWGEWYYTDHFVDNPSIPWEISAPQYANRREVIERLLSALPISRTVAVRYPFAKQQMYTTTTPLPANQAFKGTSLSRIGYHNDCFLASDTDYGTYRDSQIETDKTYLAAETNYVPMGGETCAINPPRSQCTTAVNELARFHWSYLNRDYNTDVYNSWVSGGCINQIQQRLGYRLVLKQGTYPTTAKPGGKLAIQIQLTNQGFAAPFNQRDLYLILRHTNGSIYKAKLPDDPRRWLPGPTHTISRTITLPTTFATGQYTLALHLADPTTSLSNRPEYAIRLANANLWRTTSGWNDLLHTVTVSTVMTNAIEAEGSEEEEIQLIEDGMLPESADPLVTSEEDASIKFYLPFVAN